MKRLTIALLIVLALATAALAQTAADPFAQLRSEQPQERAAAVEAVGQLGAAAIEPLFDALSTPADEFTVNARLAVRRVVALATAPGHQAERVAVANALLHQMRPDRPADVKKYALEWMSLVADASNVPALVSLMNDPDVGDMPRWVLIRIPGQAAVNAIAAEVPGAEPAQKVALLGALAQRGAGLAPALACLKDSSADVRAAALRALALIPDSRAAAALLAVAKTGPAAEQALARDCYLRLGSTLTAAGKKALAADIFQTMLAMAPSELERCEALSGLGKAGGLAEVPLLVASLGENVPVKVRGVARAALVNLPGPTATAAIVKALAAAPAASKVTLAWVLGERRDRSALPALQGLAASGSVTMQATALAALGKLGDAQAAPVLMAALASPEEQVQTAAETALARIPGDTLTNRLTEALAKASGDHKAALVRSISYRQSASVLPTLLACAKDPDPAARSSALECLSKRRDAKDHTDLFLTAARDKDEDVAVSALEALIQLKSPAAEALFLELAKQGSENVQPAAARGYIILAQERKKTDKAAALAMLKQGLALTDNPLSQNLALRSIADIADLESLPLVLPLVDQDRTRQAAAVALLPIAAQVEAGGDKQQAIELFQKVVKSTSDEGLMVEAAKHLNGLGVEIDLAASAGYITHWWVVGPLPRRDRWLKGDAFAVDQPVDLSAPVKVGNQEFPWQPWQIVTPTGQLNLVTVYGPHDDCAAYAYAEVTSPKAQEVVFSMGSDDQMMVWLNGQKVHEYLDDRGYAPDSDQATVTLQAGVNRILMKVINGGADWGGGLRILDSLGSPIQLEQRKK